MARVNVVPAVGVEQHAECVKPMGGTTHTMCKTDQWNNTAAIVEVCAYVLMHLTFLYCR